MGSTQAIKKLEPKEQRERTVYGYCHETNIDGKAIPKCIMALISEYYYFSKISFDVYHSTTSKVLQDGTLLKAKPHVYRPRLFSTKLPLEKDVIHEIKFRNTIDGCSYSGLEIGITATDEIKWISKGDVSNTNEFTYGNQYYLCRKNHGNADIVEKSRGSWQTMCQTILKKKFGVDDVIGMIIDLKKYKLTFVENFREIVTIDIDDAHSYHVFFGFRDTKMVWKVASFDGNDIA